MKSIVVKYSIIASVIIVFFMLFSTVLYHQNNDAMSLMVGFAGMLFGFSTIFFAVKKYKMLQDGTISFLDGLKIGAAITFIGALNYTIVWMIEMNLFFPNFIENYSATQIEQLKITIKNPALLSAEIEKINALAVNYKNPMYCFLITMSEIVPVGIGITLIAALVLRNKRTTN